MMLDRRLAGALKRVCAASDSAKQFYRELSQKDQEVQRVYKRILRGRQILLMILQSYKTNPKMGLVYGIQHFHDLKWMGDTKWRVSRASGTTS